MKCSVIRKLPPSLFGCTLATIMKLVACSYPSYMHAVESLEARPALLCQSHQARSRHRGLQPGRDCQDLAGKLGHIGSVFHLALCNARKSKAEASAFSGNFYQTRKSTGETKVSPPIQHVWAAKIGIPRTRPMIPRYLTFCEPNSRLASPAKRGDLVVQRP